ncbi:hypothetical protein AVEN_175240-1 [Araneus ventricosus]|uniref:CCHC-type domain-containing protein n=1 Tax=Araneus ventricosus TaxID=182803 RepID=A0A4Y2A1D3_ARAVE|nr:hypothetical protein AVEN_43103-1 [Araneus ventricosus]GBL73357.1 hypothetical protein AVEN_118432-1 [Araneus ventricosus]GBL73376.1 hypothetical protein AVEN_132911-1 [Araneus ventricosus]GBL73413.1 hypothetical protein AVEN_175240-1 [Araneus ventricosus]
MPETGALTRWMDKQFEKLFAMMAGLKQKMEAGQEEMRVAQAGLEQKMEAGQEEMRSGQERMEKGQEEMKGLIDKVKGEVQGKTDEVEEKVQMKIEDVKSEVKGKFEEVEHKVQGKIEEVEHKVQRKIGDIERRLSELEVRPFSFSASPEFMHSRLTIKSLTFDGQTSWTVFKTQFDVVSSTNGWTDFVKASQLVASLQGSAADVLQGIPADKLTDLTTIEKALESRFGDSHLTHFYRTELKTRRQKPGESLQELAADVERLMSLAYAKCPQDVRDSLAAQYFVDAIRDEETQLSTRLMDFTDLKSTLVYSMKFESAKSASKISIKARSIETDDDTWKERDDKFESLLKALEKLVNNLAAEQSAPRRNANVTCWKCFKKGHVQRACQDRFVLFLVDTGTNITLLRADLAHKVKERLIYTAPNLTLKTATGEKAKIQGKLDASIECGSRKFQHRVYIADITDSYILGLDFLQKFKFTVDLEKNEIRTGSEKISLFSGSTQHRKRTSDGKNVQSRRLCFEGCEPCSNAERKLRTETDIAVEALTLTTENRWSLSEIQKAQLEDPDIRPILKMKLNSADQPSCQEIAHESPATKRYWALWNSLYLKDGVLYRKWESNDGDFYRRQLILLNCRIQEVLRETHDNTSGRNFGVMKTLRKTRERFYWDRVRADVEKWCKECQAYGARKEPKTQQGKSVTGRTPTETFSDRTLRFPCDILFGRPRDTPSSTTHSEARLESVQASAGEQVELSRERMKIRYDSRAADHHFKEGDLVWMYNPKRRRGLSPKLQQNWEGPYTVVKKLNDAVYRAQRSPNTKPKVIHINRLTPYRATDHNSI